MPPEHFVAVVKEAWRAIPAVRTAIDPRDTRERLAAIVTLCIEEFYDE